MNDPTEIKATFWRVLRATYLEVIAKEHGQSVASFTVDQANEALAPYQESMIMRQKQLETIADQLKLLGIEQMHAKLHGQPGVDNEMLDDTIHFSNRPDPDDDGPPIPLETL